MNQHEPRFKKKKLPAKYSLPCTWHSACLYFSLQPELNRLWSGVFLAITKASITVERLLIKYVIRPADFFRFQISILMQIASGSGLTRLIDV